SREATALAESIAREQLEDPGEVLVDPSIVAGHEVRRAQVVVRGDRKRKIVDALGDRQGALGKRGRIGRMPGLPRVLAQVRRDPPQAPLIVERGGETLGAPDMLEAGLETTEGPERVPEGEVNVDALLHRLAGLSKMSERRQRLLVRGHRLAVGR